MPQIFKIQIQGHSRIFKDIFNRFQGPRVLKFQDIYQYQNLVQFSRMWEGKFKDTRGHSKIRQGKGQREIIIKNQHLSMTKKNDQVVGQGAITAHFSILLKDFKSLATQK